MMYTIARYYSTSEHMSRLFNKLTNQMIRKCKEQITDLGKLWDQDKPTLLANMRVGKAHHAVCYDPWLFFMW
jgi:dynein heavy chain